MKKIILVVFGLVLACNSSQKIVPDKTTTIISGADPKIYAETITESELKEHLFVYASDEFEGRETGQPGQKKAIEYIKNAYVELGIPAAKGDNDYYQNVPLEMSKLPSGTIRFNGTELEIGEHFLTFTTAEGSYKNIVYAGYGIEEGTYSDFEGLDVEGKLVLVKFGEPKNDDGTYKISGTNKKSVWSNMSESPDKRANLISEKGGNGMLYVDDANYARFKGYFDRMKRNNSGSLMLKPKNPEFITVLLDKTAATGLLSTIYESDTPQTINVEINLNVTSEDNEVNSENVIAFIEGSTKPNEYIVISSHLDHIGVTADGEINNGADDDGSGTVALLEIAEAFKIAADAGIGPKRSIVFLHLTGEEKGLLGSQYYTDVEPIFPLEQTVANLNIDMIGRIDPKRNGDRNYIYVIGSDKLSKDLHNLSEEINKKYAKLELDYKYNDENDPNRFYYRSDHYNFAKNNIPIIFYFNGTHEDYHRPSDTPDKINYDLLENRARLIFYTAWEISNRDKRVILDKSSK
ncbi:MAG: M28 family peptidase [Maribacter sp.]